jgi:hypothetical protein
MNFQVNLKLLDGVFLIKFLAFFIVAGNIALTVFHVNFSSYLDFVLLFILLMNFRLDNANLSTFFLFFVAIAFCIIRLPFTDFQWDSKYFFISMKVLIYCLFFISFKPKLFNNQLTLLWAKRLFLISCALVTVDKIANIIRLGLIEGLLFRPRLIGEINFDIVLIIELWLILKLFSPDYRKSYGYILFFIVIISLSRSGIIGYGLTYFFAIQLSNKFNNIKVIIRNIFILVFGILVILGIYYLRDPNLDFKNIDRIQLLSALFAIYDFSNFGNFIFGFGVLVQLPDVICNAFSFYAEQTTGSEDNCNPVILFSYYLRSIFEFGGIITFIIPYVYYKMFKIKFDKITSLVIIMPVLAVSLAVGGFYNSMSIISLVLAKSISQKSLV